MKLVLLKESQNATFDKEYHSPAEMSRKIKLISERFGGQTIRILDVGGGNGVFLDAMLQGIPNAEGYLLDISSLLLGRNAPNPRKRLIHGSVAEVDSLLPGVEFDVITVNWVVHHLVGSDYRECLKNQIHALNLLAGRLTKNGVLLVTENMIDGHLGTNLPSRIIFAITRVRFTWFIRLIERYFHTAGVGVCFHSQRKWAGLFRKCALKVEDQVIGPIWPRKLKGKLLFILLFLKSERHGHFVLTR